MAGLNRAWLGVARQLRQPSGLGGFVSTHVMGLLNEESNRIAIAKLNIAASDTVLELGFGGGRAIKAMTKLAACGRVFGIDHSAAMYVQASRRNRRAIREGRVELVHGRFSALPWQQGVIDKCLAVHVAYFMDSVEIYEVRRVLRAGGTLSILVTDKTAMEHWKIVHPSTHRLYVADDLINLLSTGGFLLEEISIQRVSLGRLSIPGLLAVARKS